MLVQFAAPPDLSQVGAGSVHVTVFGKSIFQSFSVAFRHVAAAGQHTNVPSLAGCQCKGQGIYAEFVEMRIEHQNVILRLSDGTFKCGQCQIPDGIAPRVSQDNLIHVGKTAQVAIFDPSPAL